MSRTLEERKAISVSKKGGTDIEVAQYVTLAQAKKMGYNMVLIPCFGAEQYCGTVNDVKDVMADHCLSGEFIAFRRPCGIIRRQEIVTSDVSNDGLYGPEVNEEIHNHGE